MKNKLIKLSALIFCVLLCVALILLIIHCNGKDGSNTSDLQSTSESLPPEESSTEESQLGHVCDFNILGYDNNAHWFSCECGSVAERTEHEGFDATCKKKPTCQTCGQQYGDFFTHTIQNNSCIICGKRVEGFKIQHNPDGKGYTFQGFLGETPSHVVIPDSFDGLPITKIGNHALFSNNSIYSLEIPDSITEIEAQAFASCENLLSVTLGRNVKAIADYTFIQCSSLVEVINHSDFITVEKGSSKNGMIGANALAVYNTQEEIVSGIKITDDFITLTTETDEILLHYQGSGEHVTIPNGVTEIYSRAFYESSNLKSVDITENVTTIGNYAFAKTALTEITIPDWISNLGEFVFSACPNLKSAVVGTGIRTISIGTFANCTSLEEIAFKGEITDFERESFYNCSSLTSITLPKGLTTVNSSAFTYCENLIAYYVSDIYSWLNVKFEAYSQHSYYLYVDGEMLTNLAVPSDVTEIPPRAFNACISLATVTLHENVTKIGSNAFTSCTSLVEVINNSPHIEIEQRKTNNGWLGWYALSIANNSPDYQSKVSIEDDFVIYTDTEKRLVKYTGNSEAVTVPDFVTVIHDYAFYYSPIKRITLGTGVSTIGTYAFLYSQITHVDGGSDNLTINNSAFSYCKRLTAVSLNVLNVGKRAFTECLNLITADLGNHVKIIDAQAFSNCSSLKSVNFGKTLTTIGSR